MALMIPNDYMASPSSDAGELLFNRLQRAFDDSWTIFHCFDLYGRNEDNRLLDAQIDFLLFHPAMGILVLEVKGGPVRYENGKWYQNGKLRKDFVKQAKKNKYAIIQYLQRKLFPGDVNFGNAELPLTVAHAFCFPDCFTEMHELPAGCENAVINGAALPRIKEAVENILSHSGRKYQELAKDRARLIRSFLMPVFEYGTSVFDRIGREERVFFSLTEMQCNLLTMLLDYKKVLIKGCAGSGKTLLAIKKARQLARQGKSVLLMCYNNMLGNYLIEETKDFRNRITATTYHKFCFGELQKAGYKPEGDKNSDAFWNEILPDLFTRFLAKNRIKYDALIVDEGQDFNDDYWTSISDLVEEDGYFYIFYDPDQNIFQRKLSFPHNDFSFNLSQNCRNTKEIFRKILPYASNTITLNELVPNGLPVKEFKSGSPRLRLNQLSRMLHELVENQHVPESEIVILGGHTLNKTCLGNDTAAGKFEIFENGSSGSYVVPYFTYMKFKGCEKSVVILLDVCDDDFRWNNNTALYTAMTRAKNLLYIIRK
ncbi:MAG: NERD domain-containing protein [Bacteroidota bacterium]